MKETVVVIHGLWMTGVECSLLRHRLAKDYGFDTCRFSYHTVRDGLPENIRRLGACLEKIRSGRIHLVGHSFGGVLALNYLSRSDPELPVDARLGRAVCLGPPLTGSQAARGFLRMPWGAEMLGRMIRENVIENPLEEYTGKQDVGVIAGTLGIGLGQAFSSLDGPHDGTILVSETRLPGITDHIEEHVTHVGLLFSRSVAEQTGWFLRHGEFRRG